MDKNLLPFERIKRKILIRKEAETNPHLGCNPSDRKTEQIIKYGIVNIDKPKGPTSHEVSAFVQKILKIKKSGHSGTLDPAVTGVLPIAIGSGTRVVQGLLTAGKEYVGIMHLHKEVSEKKLRQTIQKHFLGDIRQMPPIKSSVKRQLRTRTIYYFEILEIDGLDVLFKVGTQAGTYIRKLCLHPKTEILTKGGLIEASDFYSNHKKIYSFYKGKMIEKNPSATQKIPSPKTLLKFTMQSGITFIVTKDHELFKSTLKGYMMEQASKLKKGEYIIKSLKYPKINKDYSCSDLLDDEYLISHPTLTKICRKAFIKKYGGIRAMNKKLKIDRKVFLANSKSQISIKHLKLAGIYEKIKGRIRNFKTEKGKIVKLNKFNSTFFYLLGLLASDANNTNENGTILNTAIKFQNNSEKLIDIFLREYKKLFPEIQISKKKIGNNLYRLDTKNSFLAAIAASLGVRGHKKNSDMLPILYIKNSFLKAFLKGYFDGDGTGHFKKKFNVKGNYSNIRLCSASYLTAKRLHQMLLSLSISNKITTLKTGFGLIYAAELDSIASKQKFAKEINSNHPGKKQCLRQILQLPKNNVGSQHYLGIHFKEELRKNKKKLLKLGRSLNGILDSASPITRGSYQLASKFVKLPHPDDFIIEKIIKIEKINGPTDVYDMTVPDTHNFLIETGFVSSNCHDIGQKLKVGAHMAELRRTKAGPFDESTLCTLQELTDALYYHKEEKNDKFLRKIIQPIENGVSHLKKVWVLDTTVDSLAHGIDLKVPGISQVNDDIEKGSIVAIMTLKNELVALGVSQMNSKEMLGDKGIAVKADKVFMQPGTYN